MYKISNEKLPLLFAAIAENMDLYMPLHKHGQVNYGIWTNEEEPALDALNAVKSPKDLFFPQSETLYTCYKEGKKISIDPQQLCGESFAVFGIRACDVKGIEVLDRVFLADPVDSYYQARREHGVLISRACHEPDVTCFCKAFDIDAAEPVGDIVTWSVGEDLYWKPVTEKGAALTETVKELLTEADKTGEEAVEAEKEQIRAITGKLPYSSLSLDYFKNTPMQEIFDSPKWDELYKPCLACGTCTFVCPTCQCYDIRDYDTGKGIRRVRCWDSCMYSDFTLMAHGNNRKSQKERFRQRFMHKLVYYPENNGGLFSCVGCGRCVNKCPSGLNILKVIKSLGVTEDV